MNGKLSVVATPIGNLEDMTFRAVRTLREADVIFCEDTRVTGKLLKHYEIDTPMKRCDAHTERTASQEILTLLQEDTHVAYVTDAGTPGVSDPGAVIVREVREACPSCTIEAIPGPSALTAALSVSGLQDIPFLFIGFIPHKKGRETLFRKMSEAEQPVVFYESPHRIVKTLTSLHEYMPESCVLLFRELTKLHEEQLVGTAAELLGILEDSPEKLKGEFVGMVLPA